MRKILRCLEVFQPVHRKKWEMQLPMGLNKCDYLLSAPEVNRSFIFTNRRGVELVDSHSEKKTNDQLEATRRLVQFFNCMYYITSPSFLSEYQFCDGDCLSCSWSWDEWAYHDETIYYDWKLCLDWIDENEYKNCERKEVDNLWYDYRRCSQVIFDNSEESFLNDYAYESEGNSWRYLNKSHAVFVAKNFLGIKKYIKITSFIM